MKIKWLYKIALPTIATASIAPVVVSCSVEKIKPETQEEKEKRLEHQRAMEMAPNLSKFLKDYFDVEKYYREGRDTSEMKVIRNIKQLKELTANINHLNDFEKSYLGLYEDIQNFFDNSIHKYTLNNVVFDYWYTPNYEDDENFFTDIKIDENSLKPEQMFYNKIYQTINDEEYESNDIEANEETIKHFKETLTPLINEKIAEFSKKHKDFQFKNPELKFRYGKNGEKIIEVSVEVEYQNEKLPKEIVFPLTFNIKTKNYWMLKTEKEVRKSFLEMKKFIKQNENEGMQRKDVKTLAELKNLYANKPNDWNNKEIKEIEKFYNRINNEMNEKDDEPDR